MDVVMTGAFRSQLKHYFSKAAEEGLIIKRTSNEERLVLMSESKYEELLEQAKKGANMDYIVEKLDQKIEITVEKKVKESVIERMKAYEERYEKIVSDNQ